ncbi:MAG: hypothetical protein GY737_04985 [Desulfobacteraceae bacterium]|nr:hypothetical protein [Desulfobacteraceae bacterium]
MNNPVEKDGRALQTWFESYHSGELRKLNRILKHFSGFQLVLIEHNNPMYRDKLIKYIKNIHGKSCRMNVNTESFPDFYKFEEDLFELKKRRLSFVNIVPDDRWFKGEEGVINLRGFNMHRELIAENCPFSVLLWMTGDDIDSFALEARDMWAWRTAVFDFTTVFRTAKA